MNSSDSLFSIQQARCWQVETNCWGRRVHVS